MTPGCLIPKVLKPPCRMRCFNQPCSGSRSAKWQLNSLTHDLHLQHFHAVPGEGQEMEEELATNGMRQAGAAQRCLRPLAGTAELCRDVRPGSERGLRQPVSAGEGCNVC